MPLTDAVVVSSALAAVAGAWSASVAVAGLVGVALAVLVALFDGSSARWMLVVLVAIGGVGAVRGDQAAGALEPAHLGDYRGWVQVVNEPRSYASATRVIVSVERQRYEVWSRDDAQQSEILTWRGGDLVLVSGNLRHLPARRAERVAWQHVVGRLRLDVVHDTAEGSRLARFSNEVRRSVERSAAVLPGAEPALFRGLVIGDRRDQSDEMVERFRRSGLAHLTVVSGLNVALLLAVAGPLLRRLRSWNRWALTILLVLWFVSLTRFEPSIVRAGAMATISATAFVLGRDRAPFRVLCLAVTVLVVVDPLLVHAVGFWLSTGATAGVCTIGPWLAARLRWLGPLAMPTGITLGAEIGVAVPLVATFGHLPLVSVPANLLAVPVASAVKLYGLPAALVGGWVPWTTEVLMLPCRLGVRWVDTVALVAARLEPGGTVSLVGWVVVAVGIVAVAAMKGGSYDDPPDHR